MVMSTAEPAYEPESPLDVLSRAASLVESGASSGESQSETEPSPPRASAPASLKELHPKFRKMSASGVPGPMVMGRSSCATPPPSYTQSLAASGHMSSPEEAPLDFSIRKRSLSPSSDGPPPYKYANPLRQHSPPLTRASQSPSSSLPSSVPSSSSSHHLPVNPAPSYYRPPPYPRTPSPPPAPPSEARPPPPTYEAAMASKPTSPRVSLTSTSPTFMTLTTRPSPTTIKTGSSEYSSASSSSPTKTDSAARPSVICTGPSAGSRSEEPHVTNLFKKEENKENKDLSETPRSRKREVTIVEESGAVDLMEEHFRKSLGADYKKVFKGEEKAPEQMEVDPVKAFKEDLDMSGYTVEDHFAKALGDTWVKLQAEAEKKDKKSVGHKESKTQLLAL